MTHYTLSHPRGFLPDADPLSQFAADSPFASLDQLGHDLPSLLMDPGFRDYATALTIPPWPEDTISQQTLPALRLYYLRVGFLASGYINQVGQPPATRLPANIARPLVHACELLQRPPILSYDGYALYNWKRFDTSKPITLGNIDTIQNFVHLYDEHWFILIHVEIETLAVGILDAITDCEQALQQQQIEQLNTALTQIERTLRQQIAVLKRIPEHMDAHLYFQTFRPYIRFFEDVVYEGVQQQSINFRGETGAQSSIMPLMVALMKIPHRASPLLDHLHDMRNYMPLEHRQLIEKVEAMPDLKPLAGHDEINAVLAAMADFREVHYGWAQQYISRWVDDPRGTGGTPYMQWLKQLIEETLAAMAH